MWWGGIWWQETPGCVHQLYCSRTWHHCSHSLMVLLWALQAPWGCEQHSCWSFWSFPQGARVSPKWQTKQNKLQWNQLSRVRGPDPWVCTKVELSKPRETALFACCPDGGSQALSSCSFGKHFSIPPSIYCANLHSKWDSFPSHCRSQDVRSWVVTGHAWVAFTGDQSSSEWWRVPRWHSYQRGQFCELCAVCNGSVGMSVGAWCIGIQAWAMVEGWCISARISI